MESIERLKARLEAVDAAGWVALAPSGSDPDVSPFVGGAHLGQMFLLAAAGGEVRLGYFTEMERDEARATGLPLAGPSELDLEALRGLGLSPGGFLADSVARAASLLGMEPGRLLVAGTAPAGDLLDFAARLQESGWRLESGASIARSVRKYKGAEHLEEIRRVAGYLCRAFRRVAAVLAGAEPDGEELSVAGAPLTAGRLRSEIRSVFAEGGLDQPRGNIVAMGSDSGVPHTAGDDDRVLRRGESLIVDLYPKGHLFADCTRTFCVGEPSEELERAHTLVREALAAAHAEAGVGRTGWELQQSTCDRLGRAGYATPISDPGATSGYVHGLGHGVGFDLHEEPSFRAEAGESGVLEVGDVFTLEPGLYEPASERGYGVRLEDTVALTESGLENLTPLPYALDPHEW